jgi:hypothetical protein
MKLDWEINEFRVLKAKVGEVTYYVAPGAVNLWKPSKRYTAFDGKVEAEGAVDGMSLANAIAWCERDVERPEGCPAPAPSTQAPEPSSVEDRLARLEARQEAEDRAGLVAQLPGLYDKVGRLSLELCMLPVDRLRDMARRIAELESWLGTKKYAPEDNLASKTWTKLEQLTNRLERLEART